MQSVRYLSRDVIEEFTMPSIENRLGGTSKYVLRDKSGHGLFMVYDPSTPAHASIPVRLSHTHPIASPLHAHALALLRSGPGQRLQQLHATVLRPAAALAAWFRQQQRGMRP